MDSGIDKKYVTRDILIKRFPHPERYHEAMRGTDPFESCLQRYLKFRNRLNQKRAKSGKSPYSDGDLAEIFNQADGYVVITKRLKQ